jgi:hypothetical protein
VDETTTVDNSIPASGVSGRVARMFDDVAAIGRIAELERVKSAAAAEQARLTAALVAVRPGRGVASEVALARRDSPIRGGRHVGLAKALVGEMPHTLAALECGVLSEWRATLIVRESACLSAEDRRHLDVELCAEVSSLEGKGDRRIAAEAKAIAYRLDPHAVVERAARAETERTVTIRPAPDCMTYVTALLPMSKGVGVYAALKRAADTTFDERSRGQIMADALYERVTGAPAEAASPVAVNMTIGDEALLGESEEPAVVEDYGPIPARVARRMIVDAATDPRSRASLRRLYRRKRALAAMESRARRFPKSLALMIRLRDQRCRTPYCDAPIRHLDHATPHAAGGATSAANGQGSCERCNYVKETAGWTVTTSTDEAGLHTAEFTTPTGARYRSTPPPLPGAA